jgi:hypothetical protein
MVGVMVMMMVILMMLVVIVVMMLPYSLTATALFMFFLDRIVEGLPFLLVPCA